MEYTKGILAFIDVLGFSEYIKKENCPDSIFNIMTFADKLEKLFDETKAKGKVKFANFSDTVILTTEGSIWDLLLPIDILSRCLYDELGLYYRGAIAKGDFYHTDNIAFGPVLITAHENECRAVEARIIIENGIIENQERIEFFRDIDNNWCINPYWNRIWDDLPYDVYPDNIIDVQYKCNNKKE